MHSGTRTINEAVLNKFFFVPVQRLLFGILHFFWQEEKFPNRLKNVIGRGEAGVPPPATTLLVCTIAAHTLCQGFFSVQFYTKVQF